MVKKTQEDATKDPLKDLCVSEYILASTGDALKLGTCAKKAHTDVHPSVICHSF